MQILKADEDALSVAVETLAAGEVILIPTETVYGLAVDSSSETALNKLRQLKGRQAAKPFQWLVSDVNEVCHRVSCWDPKVAKLAEQFWPGPLTIVLEGTGWRVPDHSFLRKLLQKFGRPVAATSANLAGEKPALSCQEAVDIFQGKIALALDGGRGSVGKASSVVKIVGSTLEVLRDEAIPRDELMKVWRSSLGV